MTISAKIIADSISPHGIRLTTLQLRYPKFIHGEFMTHRVFSRNASSSRAIPVDRLLRDVADDPAMPVRWFKNQPGMQGEHEVSGEEREQLVAAWLRAGQHAVDMAAAMQKIGAHKQHINRVIEPFCHINVVVTATEWSNFFALRDHPAAQPEIAVLAREMRAQMDKSRPRLLRPGQWHLPYWDDADQTFGDTAQEPIKASVARCARVSYLTQDGKQPELDKDLALYERLVGGVPLHASPAEHQATPDTEVGGHGGGWQNPRLHGNLHGWIQFRKTLRGECS